MNNESYEKKKILVVKTKKEKKVILWIELQLLGLWIQNEEVLKKQVSVFLVCMQVVFYLNTY